MDLPSRRLILAALAAGFAPAVAGAGIAPPWPAAMGFATSGCVLIAIVFSLQARASAGEPPRKLLRIVLAAVLAVTGATYLILFERFTFELPTTGGRIVVGCGFTSEAADVAARSLIDTAGDCPGHYEELLEKAQYEAHFIWTKRSIAAVRLALAGLWSVWFACFTGGSGRDREGSAVCAGAQEDTRAQRELRRIRQLRA